MEEDLFDNTRGCLDKAFVCFKLGAAKDKVQAIHELANAIVNRKYHFAFIIKIFINTTHFSYLSEIAPMGDFT